MKKSRFTESEIVWILKEADAGMLVDDEIRRHGISTTTYVLVCSWLHFLKVRSLRKTRDGSLCHKQLG